jgi:NADPH-dependent curcumin reductase CurA
MGTNRQLILNSRPDGRVSLANFEIRDSALRTVQEGEVLVRTQYLSIDPTNRIWMSDRPQYMPPVELGSVMRGFGIGEVIESRRPDFQPGDLVAGLLGWQTHCYSDASALRPLQKLPSGLGVPPRAFLGSLGMTGGLTAYFGMMVIGQPKAGETVVVSAAAGSVGSLAGQLAKRRGCRVIGIAGSPEKCQYVTSELGFDACIDYAHEDVGTALDRLCPNGIDVYFENVGGAILEAVLARLQLRARIVLCGMISHYNDKDVLAGPRNFDMILHRRARIEGFIVSDFIARFPEAFAELVPLVLSGQLKYREHIVSGLENAPAAVNMLFDGKNLGKLLLQVAPDAAS